MMINNSNEIVEIVIFTHLRDVLSRFRPLNDREIIKTQKNALNRKEIRQKENIMDFWRFRTSSRRANLRGVFHGGGAALCLAECFYAFRLRKWLDRG